MTSGFPHCAASRDFVFGSIWIHCGLRRAAYLRLEECLGEHDRDWRRCQNEVQALRACNARRTTAGAAGGPQRATGEGAGAGGDSGTVAGTPGPGA